jgi:hypothetical protein
MQILNKISIGAIFGGVKNVWKMIIEGEQVDLLLVVGVVKKKELFKKTFGDAEEPSVSWGFEGTFKAQRLDTKEQFRSARCFLPALAADIIAVQCTDDDTNLVQFAFVIGIKDNEKTATGYEYTAKSLIKPVEDESMLAIQKQVQGNLPEEDKGKYAMDEFLNTQITPQVGHEKAP